ncbi:MAG: 2,3-bisphosphoglycerate-independent phosphoglycerate mutase [Patescibacteria group bacterium]|nr:2,3-bisphosphoglycerate-independent phosphoglycerate mutase [Patescibacteria group bacterium]MBU1870836.1 2,3-bisphosphoglycerate-independent phosphoglycerate mutase [Patescibacteria group bacterium]
MSKKQNIRPKPVVLMVLDGWGVAQPYSGNAITQANIPNINNYIAQYPAMTIKASGEAVGLPWGEPGNSEVGHLNLGLGKIFYQTLSKINKTISDDSFYQNTKLLAAISHIKKNKTKLHLFGLVSNGGVHSSIDHLEALLVLAKMHEVKQLYIHVILDGRDAPYNSGIDFIKQVEQSLVNNKLGKIVTLVGRFYAMDRDNHWDRTKKAYEAMVLGKGNKNQSVVAAIAESYEKKIFDEEFSPTIICENKQPEGLIEDNDAVIFFNFRPDRARQITKAFVLPGLNKFKRENFLKNLFFVCFTEYEKALPVQIVFEPEINEFTLGETIARAGFTQLRIAETEKYAHVTYFFNGGKETKSLNEDHILIPSPRVANYEVKPEMSALEITNRLIEEINSEKYDFILVNFANADMIGHTGNLKATIQAIEFLDKCVDKIVKLVLSKNGLIFITADHGNAESMFNMRTNAIDKEHSNNPVPFIVVGKQYEGKNLIKQVVPGNDLSLIHPQGILSDVAPTILKAMDINKQEEMTGYSLI